MTFKNSSLSPGKRNGVNAYLQRYLDNVTDWGTYTASPDDFTVTVRRVTETFFSSRKLKGAALLLSAHLLQQATASVVSLVVRTALRGRALDTYRGLAIRHSKLIDLWAGRVPPWLQERIRLSDSFYFHEGGRTWHCHTLTVTFAPALARALSSLTLLSFPNRSFYFDRAIPYTEAVDLALGLKDPDSVSGFIGDFRELDSLAPTFRILKLALYSLNWLLIDEEERDAGGPDVAGYNDLGYPSGPPSWGGAPPWGGAAGAYSSPGDAGSGYPGSPSTWRSNPYAPPGEPSNYPYTQTPNAAPYQPAHDPAPRSPIPYPLLPTPRPIEVTLVPAPIRVKLSRQRPDGGHDPIWHTLEENTYLVLHGQNRQTGLGVAPLIDLHSDGVAQPLADQWSVVHLETGYLLSDEPLDSIYQARELAGLLAGLDWMRPFEQMPAGEIDRARQIVRDYYAASRALRQR